ncbi:hypothetical protein DFH11DRAFT_688760 [Phellopilus nigrolimitatus]|nr:hypothetical protein DFH11DRAFT_688760 [Phellopilus nigrolimitatus]
MTMKRLSDASIFTLSESSQFNALTSRKYHIQRLNDILLLAIERSDLPRARRAWAILARCKEFDWKTKWRTSMLLQDPGSGQSPQTARNRNLELLKKLRRHLPNEQESILQEIVLRLADAGEFREALDELDLYLPSFPYQDNAVLHSYAGLMSLSLATEVSFEESNSQNTSVNLLRDARRHFNRSLTIDPDNLVTKTFFEEVSTRLANVHMPGTQTHDDGLSEEDMDVDISAKDDEIRLRSKRARRASKTPQ